MPITKSMLLRIAKLRQQEADLRHELNALREKIGPAAGAFSCWQIFEGGGIGLSMPIPDYLALWPDAKSVVKSYTSTLDGKLHVWTEWPWQSVGEGLHGAGVWAKAETDSMVLDMPEGQETGKTEEKAAVAA